MARRDRRRERFGPPREERALALVPPVHGAVGRVPVGRDLAPPSITLWTPTTFSELGWQTVDAIVMQAQRGMTSQFVDLTRRMLRSDTHMLSGYETRIDAVAGAPYSVKPPGSVSASRRAMAELAANDCAVAMRGLGWERLAAHLLDAVFLGYAVAEIVWAVRGGMVWPVEVILHHPRRFQFADDFSLYVYDDGIAAAGARTNAASNAMGPPLARDKFIVHTPASIPDYPTQAGLFYALVRPWWAKSWALKFWMSGAENSGNPKLVGTLSQNADHVTRSSFATAIQSLSADSQCVVNEGASLEYLEQSGTPGTIWQDLVGTWDAAISKIILGSTLNVEIGSSGGNRAAAESQDATTIVPRLERDQRMLWATIERCLFEPFLRFNIARYGGVMPDMPVGASEIVRQKAEVDELVVSRGACTWDELRASRGLEPWGASGGGESRVPAADGPSVVGDVGDMGDENVAATALNGAQVTALQGLLASVSIGDLAGEAAVIAITSAFPTIDEARVRRMVTSQESLPRAEVPPGGAAAAAPLRASMPWHRASRALSLRDP